MAAHQLTSPNKVMDRQIALYQGEEVALTITHAVRAIGESTKSQQLIELAANAEAVVDSMQDGSLLLNAIQHLAQLSGQHSLSGLSAKTTPQKGQSLVCFTL
jgi:hypothetical protein